MKTNFEKAAALSFVLLMVFLLSGCEETQAPALITKRWKVCEVREKSILAFPEEHDSSTAELCTLPLLNVDETNGELVPGAVAEIVHEDCVLETWPGQIPGVKSITVVEPGEDFITLYLHILEEVYQTDPGLNPDSSQGTTANYGFDLTGIQNLEEMEKKALAYLFTCDHPGEAVFGTFDELCEQGHIDKEDLYWENGTLFVLKDEAAENGTFSFSVEKWRGGTGADLYTDCQAKKENGQWRYELDGFAIS